VLVIVILYFAGQLNKISADIRDIKEDMALNETRYTSNLRTLTQRIKSLEQALAHKSGEHVPDEKPVEQAFSKTMKTESVDTDKAAHDRKRSKLSENPFFTVLINLVLGPFTRIAEIFSSAYRYYKNIDKGPDFFMTAFGITALVTGLGYILKYSFENVFSDITKSSVIFVFSIFVIFLGQRISRKKDYLSDYGSALMGLGIITNFMNIYFLDISYNLISSGPAFVLTALNTLVSIGLALKFEARVISAVSLLGGAFMPFFLDTGHLGIFFFIYLFIITAASVYTARKIYWPGLVFLSFTVSAFCLENFVFFNKNLLSPFQAGLVIHAFAYFFMIISADTAKYYDLSEQKEPADSYKRLGLNIFFSSLILFIVNVYYTFIPLNSVIQALGSAIYTAGPADVIKASMAGPFGDGFFSFTYPGMIFFANALVFIVWALGVHKDSGLKKRRHLLMFTAAVLCALGAVLIVHNDFSGFLWGIEAILLIHLGFIIKDGLVRKEGLLLFCIGLIKLFYTFGGIQLYWDKYYFTPGMANLYLSFFLLIFLSLILKRNLPGPASPSSPDGPEPGKSKKEYSWERGFYCVIQELIPLNALFLFHLTSFYYFDDYAYSLSLIPMVLVLHYSGRRNLRWSHLAGLFHYIIIASQMFISIYQVESFHFSDQTIYGQIARVESFLLLWILLAFYRKFIPNHPYKEYMNAPREFFYLLIPIIIPLPFRRHFPEYLSLAVWAAFGINIILNEKLNYLRLRFESGLILVSAILISVRVYLVGPGPASLIALFSFASGILMLLWLYKYRSRLSSEKAFLKSPYKFHNYLLFYSLPLFILVFCAKTLTNAVLGQYLFLISLISLLYWHKKFLPMTLAYSRNLFFLRIYALIITISTFLNPWEIRPYAYTHLAAGGLSLVLYAGYIYYCVFSAFDSPKSTEAGFIRPVKDILLVNFAVFVFYYLFFKTWDRAFLTSGLSICMAFHAAVLMFQSLDKGLAFLEKTSFSIFIMLIFKLYFFDLSGLSTIEKTMVFTGVGTILLVGAYRFQVFKERIRKGHFKN
jgi:hypothetical protein